MLKIDKAFISNVENGKTNPTLATIEKIAKALEISIDELVK
jgi:transcriptional regulator with XRE-family HTH domain